MRCRDDITGRKSIALLPIYLEDARKTLHSEAIGGGTKDISARLEEIDSRAERRA